MSTPIFQSLQDLFNTAVRGLASQGFVRSGEMKRNSRGFLSFQCAYRGPLGTKCAIGHCVPDELMRSEYECISICGPSLTPLRRALIADVEPRVLAALQESHDHADGPDDMRARLRYFASNHGLTCPPELTP